MERFIHHLRTKFSIKEHRLLFEDTPEAPKQTVESTTTPESIPSNDEEVQNLATQAKAVTENKITTSEEKSVSTAEAVAETVGENEEVVEGEPKTHAERITRGLTESSKNYKEGKVEAKEAADELAAAQKKLEAAKKNPDDTKAIEEAQAEVDAAEAKLEAAKQKQLQSALEMIAYIFDLIARLFDGSLLDDPNKEEEEKEDDKEEPSDESNSPTQIVKETLKSGESGSVEQIRANLTNERTAATDKIQGNNTRIEDLRTESRNLETKKTTLSAQEEKLRGDIAAQDNEAQREELTRSLTAVSKELQAVIAQLASVEQLIQGLDDDTKEQEARITGIDRALAEIIQPLENAVNQVQETLGLSSAPQIINNGTININVNNLDDIGADVINKLGVTPDEKGDVSITPSEVKTITAEIEKGDPAKTTGNPDSTFA